MQVVFDIVFLVFELEYVMLDCIQWVYFYNLLGQDINVLNIYVLLIFVECCQLWMELINVLFRDCCWFLVGNQNVIEVCLNKFNIYGLLFMK